MMFIHMFYIGLVLSVFTGVLAIASHFLNKDVRELEQSRRLGQGVVEGYGHEDGDQLQVRLVSVQPDDEIFLDRSCSCNVNGRLYPGQCPIGRVVDVFYIQKQFLSKPYPSVWLAENYPVGGLKSGKVLNRAVLVFGVVAAVALVCGTVGFGIELIIDLFTYIGEQLEILNRIG